MSIAANAIGQMPIAADPRPAQNSSKTPPNRTITPKPDVVQQPEAR